MQIFSGWLRCCTYTNENSKHKKREVLNHSNMCTETSKGKEGFNEESDTKCIQTAIFDSYVPKEGVGFVFLLNCTTYTVHRDIVDKLKRIKILKFSPFKLKSLNGKKILGAEILS